MRIISQVYVGDGKFMLQLGGLSTETKPTDSFVATGSQFIEDDTDAVFSFNGSTWDLDKNGQMKDLPVVTATDNGKILKVDNGVWSIGIDSGSSLPSMTGKNGKVLGVTLDAQENEQIEWVTPSGGGGAEKFVVTLTEDDSGDDPVWTADKTIAEIVAADAANQVVVAKYPVGVGSNIELPLVTAFDVQGVAASGFTGFDKTTSERMSVVTVSLLNQGSGDVIQVVEIPIPTSSNAPLIVTMTADQSTGNLVGDKTYKEVYDAFDNGQAVICKGALGGSPFSAMVIFAGVMGGTTYVVHLTLAGQDTEGGGTANDYLTITMGG